jgi:hypothetical protein
MQYNKKGNKNLSYKHLSNFQKITSIDSSTMYPKVSRLLNWTCKPPESMTMSPSPIRPQENNYHNPAILLKSEKSQQTLS